LGFDDHKTSWLQSASSSSPFGRRTETGFSRLLVFLPFFVLQSPLTSPVQFYDAEKMKFFSCSKAAEWRLTVFQQASAQRKVDRYKNGCNAFIMLRFCYFSAAVIAYLDWT
jgi:hypothetical protein